MDFVLSGRAKEVFRWLEIKTERALKAQRELLEMLQEGHLCWWDVNEKENNRCSIPMNMSCSLIDCPVFVKKFGKREKR